MTGNFLPLFGERRRRGR